MSIFIEHPTKPGLRFEFPENSAELYANPDKFEAIYGDDIIFVAGEKTLKGQGTTKAGVEYIDGVDIDVVLSKKIVIDPKVLKEPQKERAGDKYDALLTLYHHLQNPAVREQCPTYTEVRQQKGPGQGLVLLSGGGFCFLRGDFGRGLEICLALFLRTDGSNKLTGADGLISGPLSGVHEIAEEYSFVITQQGNSVAYAPLFTGPGADIDDDILAMKRGQYNRLIKGLSDADKSFNLEKIELKIALLPVTDIPCAALGLPTNSLRLFDGDRVVDTITGAIGFEVNNNTVTWRRFGEIVVPEKATLHIVDGEPFNRLGRAWSLDELTDKKPAMISSAAAIITTIIAQNAWPEITPHQPSRIRRLIARLRAACTL